MSVLIPSQVVSPPPVLPDSPFRHLAALARTDLAATRDLPAAERRLLTEHFVSIFQWETIRPLLPLRLELPPGVPLWRARHCRSTYVWLPPDDIRCADDLLGLDNFDLVLRLFDFSPWRAILGQRFSSAYGPPPFDPVSIGLAWLLARWRNWTWPQLLTELHSPERGLGYCRRLGFSPNDIPAESTFRVALDNTAKSYVLQCEDSLLLGLMAYGIVPTASTFPSDPPGRGVSVASDSQLVESRSRMLCHHQNSVCFLPRATRTCAARADGHDGCACDTVACADHCRLSTPRDPEAAYVYYSGVNQPTAPAAPSAAETSHGKHHFGYKSKAFNVVDDRLFALWPISGPFVPANRNDHLQTIPGLKDLRCRFPNLSIGEFIADAGEGFDEILQFVHDDLKALRTITPRHHATDADPLACLRRGYDGRGNPLCSHGYCLAFNLSAARQAATITGAATASGSVASAAYTTLSPTFSLLPPQTRRPQTARTRTPTTWCVSASPSPTCLPTGRRRHPPGSRPPRRLRHLEAAHGPPQLFRKPQCRPGPPRRQTLSLLRYAQQRQSLHPG